MTKKKRFKKIVKKTYDSDYSEVNLVFITIFLVAFCFLGIIFSIDNFSNIGDDFLFFMAFFCGSIGLVVGLIIFILSWKIEVYFEEQ